MARYYRFDSRVLQVPCLFESSRAGSRRASESLASGVRDVADEVQGEFYSRGEPQPAESVPGAPGATSSRVGATHEYTERISPTRRDT